jgi:hypothetical protein
MVKESDVSWFKREFGAKINAAVKGTPLTLDHLTAIALQETGYIWARLQRKNLSTARILELCVGDTIDGRSAFPKDKAALLAVTDGDKMFAIARQGLVAVAEHFADTKLGEVAKNPDKFCHGFGIFQYDIQFFLDNPKYFLERQYANFDIALARCVEELKRGLKTVGVADKPSLTDEEAAHVAIAYNTGRFNPAKGLKQGHPSDGKFYGESYFEWLQLAHKVPLPAEAPS